MSKITLPYPATPTPFYKIVFPDFSKMKFGKPSPNGWTADRGQTMHLLMAPNGALAINPLISVENPIVSGPPGESCIRLLWACTECSLKSAPKLMAGYGPKSLQIKGAQKIMTTQEGGGGIMGRSRGTACFQSFALFLLLLTLSFPLCAPWLQTLSYPVCRLFGFAAAANNDNDNMVGIDRTLSGTAPLLHLIYFSNRRGAPSALGGWPGQGSIIPFSLELWKCLAATETAWT